MITPSNSLASTSLRCCGLLALAALLTFVQRAHAANFVASPTGEKMVIKIEQLKKWKDSRENVQHVLNSTASTLWRHFPNRRVGELLVRPKGGPITLSRRGPKGERYVWLDTGDVLWCQYSFQFAHEVGHVLTDNIHYKHRNMWFEESLCELCSLFALRQLAEDWDKLRASKWKRYVPSVRTYAQQRLDKGKLPDGKSFKTWFDDELPSLYTDRHLRMKNLVVARQLLPMFEAEPKHLATIGYLNRGEIPKIKRFDKFLENWHKQAPKDHKAFIAQVAKEFGIAVPPK